jgi:hypothetical protein
LDRKPRTLAQWAWEGRGPHVMIINGRAYYDLDDLRAYNEPKLLAAPAK